MTAKALMILGATAGVVGAVASIVSPIGATVMLFVAGALFGKGYGVWEKKSEIDSLRADLFAKEIEALGYLRAVGMLQARLANAEASPDERDSTP